MRNSGVPCNIRTFISNDLPGHLAPIIEPLHDQLDARNNRGTTMLMYACSRNSIKCATLLIEKGADVNVVDYEGNTAMHHARKGRCIALLIKSGANINAKNHRGCTPLHIAVEEDEITAVRALVEYGADTEAVSDDGKLPVDMMYHSSNKNIKDLLNGGNSMDVKGACDEDYC